MIFTFVGIVDMLLQITGLIIIVQVILSLLIAFNVINSRSGFVSKLSEVLERITSPIYRPVRKILPDFGGIDFSPFVILLLIAVLREKVLPGILLELGPTIT